MQFQKNLLLAGLGSITAFFAIALIAPPAYAAPTAESCFATTGTTTRTITNYYNNEGNNAANPACPRDVEIPSTIGGAPVTAIAGPSNWSGAFESKRLTGVIVPNSITSIGYMAFGDNYLTNIIIPNSVTTIGDYAFQFNRLTSLTIPSSVISIGDSAFAYNDLTFVDVLSDVPNVGAGSFVGNAIDTLTYDGVIYTSSQPNNELCYGFNAATGSISLFYQADLSLIKSDGQACLNRSVVVPDTIGGEVVTGIGGYSFFQTHLTNLEIPASVDAIGLRAFYGNSLTSITIQGNPTLDADAFAFNGLNRSTLPAGMTWDQQLTYYQDNASLVNIYATDPDFIATHSPGHLYTYASGGTTYAASGYLINPASATITHESSSGSAIAPQTTIVGKTSDGTLLTTYSLAATLDTTTNPASPTIDFAAYYKAGDTITIEPHDIPGYVLPASFTTTLAAGNNPESLVYLTQAEVDANTTPSSTPTPPNTDTTTGRLAETGMGGGMAVVAALFAGVAGMGLVVYTNNRKQTNRYQKGIDILYR